MNIEPLDEAYFKWLVEHVTNVRTRNPSVSSWSILKQLHTTEFVWILRNDDNRVEDGRELRFEFLEYNPDYGFDPDWLSVGCSFLEMLIALAKRLEFQTERVSLSEWFWNLLDNANLNIFDREYERDRMESFVDQVLQRLNNRTYGRDGTGGLFPLQDDSVDQTKVEIWYQMNYYLLERS